jgi:hypothetical protein
VAARGGGLAVLAGASRLSGVVAEQYDAAICRESGEKQKYVTCARNDVEDPIETFAFEAWSRFRRSSSS